MVSQIIPPFELCSLREGPVRQGHPWLPITLEDLLDPSTSTIDGRLFALGFFGSYAPPSHKTCFHPRTWQWTRMCHPHILLYTWGRGVGTMLHLVATGESLCPVTSMLAYLASCSPFYTWPTVCFRWWVPSLPNQTGSVTASGSPGCWGWRLWFQWSQFLHRCTGEGRFERLFNQDAGTLEVICLLAVYSNPLAATLSSIHHPNLI